MGKTTGACIVTIFMVFAGASFAEENGESKKVPFLPSDSIQTIREKIKQNGYSFRVRDYEKELGRNFFVPGLHPNKENVKSSAQAIPLGTIKPLANLPEKFDWRDVNGKSYIGPVRNQMPLGSCYAFAACAAAESAFNIASNRYNEQCVDFSESYLIWILGAQYPYSEHFYGGRGSDQEFYELTALTRYGMNTGWEGIAFEEDLPYVTFAGEIPSDKRIAFPRVQFDGWSRVYSVNYEDTTDLIKTAILTDGVVYAGIMTSRALIYYMDGVYEDTETEPANTPYYYELTDHAVALVGWDDHPPEGGGGCWIVRNSNGEEWGEKGYVRIRYYSAHVNMGVAYLAYASKSVMAFTGKATAASSHSAVLAGFVKTGGETVSYHFEYGQNGDLNRQSPERALTPAASVSIYTVTETIDALELGADYSYRLVVKSPGTNASTETTVESGNNEDVTGEGEASPSQVFAGNTYAFLFNTASIDDYGPLYNNNYLIATMRGSIATDNLPASVWLEYGAGEVLDRKSPTIRLPHTDKIEISLEDTQPNTIYHYRWVADNGTGVVYSEKSAFETPPFIFFQGFEWNDDYSKGFWLWEYNQNEYEDYPDYAYVWKYVQNGIACPKIAPASPYQGEYNICFTFNRNYIFHESYEEIDGFTADLVSSPLHMSQFPQAFLHFLYAMPVWGGDQDILRVYYRTSANGEWKLIPGAEFANDVTAWTEATFDLPELSPAYQIKFEGTAHFGWGIALDNVSITLNRETSVLSWSLY